MNFYVNALPVIVLESRYNTIPFKEYLCHCGDGKIETLEHVL